MEDVTGLGMGANVGTLIVHWSCCGGTVSDGVLIVAAIGCMVLIGS